MLFHGYNITMKRYAEPLEHVYGVARDFLGSLGRQGAYGNAKFTGSLILLGDPDLIGDRTGFYNALYEKMSKEIGRTGYDDPERLRRLIERVSLKNGTNDIDGGVAFTPDMEFEGLGRFVEITKKDIDIWRTSDQSAMAQEIKGEEPGGKHMAGHKFSSYGASSLVLSENGESIITFNDGYICPKYSVKLKSTEPVRNESNLYFFPSGDISLREASAAY